MYKEIKTLSTITLALLLIAGFLAYTPSIPSLNIQVFADDSNDDSSRDDSNDDSSRDDSNDDS
ncbi:MAG: hypothetical protein QXK74_06365, partial [Candidatus Nitrosocaldaceae archaeon]